MRELHARRDTITSSSAPDRPAAWSRTACRPIPLAASCCWRPVGPIGISGSSCRSATTERSTTSVFRACSRPSRAKTTGGRSIIWPRGRVLGGSSSINGLIFIRGQHEDFDDWERLGAAGWSYRELLPVFPSLRALLGRREPVSRRARRVRGVRPAQQQFCVRSVGRSRRRIRTAAQPRLQRRDDIRRRRLPARHRPALAHQFCVGIPEAGRPSPEPDGHHQRAGQQGDVSGSRRHRRRVGQEYPDIQRYRGPRGHPLGWRVAVATDFPVVGRRPGRSVAAAGYSRCGRIRRRSGAICRITTRRA